VCVSLYACVGCVTQHQSSETHAPPIDVETESPQNRATAIADAESAPQQPTTRR
jgi:hypothetical protein